MLKRIYTIDGTEQLSGVPFPNCTVTDLVYDTDTKIVYYKFVDESNCSRIGKLKNSYVGYMSPYLGYHGRPCRFIDCEIVEIPKDE